MANAPFPIPARRTGKRAEVEKQEREVISTEELRALRLDFDRRLMLQFRRSVVTLIVRRQIKTLNLIGFQSRFR